MTDIEKGGTLMEFRRIRRGVPVSSTIISLFMTVLFGLSVPSAVGADETSFAKVVQSCFSSWVPDGSDRLTPSQINRLMFSHQVKGDEAAAVAAIHVYFRKHKAAGGLRKGDLLQADMAEDSDPRSADSPEVRGFEKRFKKFSNHLRTVPRIIFANDAPRLEGIHQGPLGDCWVLSAIGAAVHSHPMRLKKMILPQPDGSCIVEFPDGRTVRVNRLTDSQIALGSTAGDQGLWLNVLEQAFGQVRKRLVPKYRLAIGLDALNPGGDASRSISRLTGHAARTFHIRRKRAKAFRPDLARRPRLVARVRNIIQKGVARRHLICAATPKPGRSPKGIAHSHDYAVLDYHRDSDTITVWNPWGSKFEPKGPSGLRNGYAMVNGVFHMPVRDFTLTFGAIYFQTSRPKGIKRR
jgi:hypothetical protein